MEFHVAWRVHALGWWRDATATQQHKRLVFFFFDLSAVRGAMAVGHFISTSDRSNTPLVVGFGPENSMILQCDQ